MASLPHRGQRAALRRRLVVLSDVVRRRVAHRLMLHEYADAGIAIRAALRKAGIARRGVSCLRYADDAARQLAASGDTPASRQADLQFAQTEPGMMSQQGLADKAARRLPGLAGGGRPGPGASLLDWYAWALATGGGAGATLSRGGPGGGEGAAGRRAGPGVEPH